jgi:phage-related protein
MSEPVLGARFYRLAAGGEPVRDWLKSLSKEDRTAIGEEIKTVQYEWPLGMPKVRKLGTGLWESRVSLPDHRIARVTFTIHMSNMILLTGFFKTSNKTPRTELKLARERQLKVKGWK